MGGIINSLPLINKNKIGVDLIMKMLKCHKCDREWNYKGDSVWYASCPRCLYKVKVFKSIKPQV